ncbi:C39 family peptidase [Sphingomonas sp. MMS24-JH45]
MAARLTVLALMLATAGCAAAPGGPSRFMATSTAVGDYSVPVASVIERRYAGVVRQQYDFSCGSAALATLLRHHYDLDVEETTAFRGMWARGDREQIRRLGFSLLDMKRWLASRGLAADGYRVPLAKVAETGVPGIALIAVKNYRHFVVVKGVSRDEVLLGDPSTGMQAMPRTRFEAAWNGIYFVLGEDAALARTRFNRQRQWAAFTRAPVGGRFHDPVSQQALSLTAPFFGDLS